MFLQDFYYGCFFYGERFHYNYAFRKFYVSALNEKEALEQAKSFARKFGLCLKERWNETKVYFSVKELPLQNEKCDLSSFSDEELWGKYNSPDDGYDTHSEGVGALCELIKRGVIKEHPWKDKILHPKKKFSLPYIRFWA